MRLCIFFFTDFIIHVYATNYQVTWPTKLLTRVFRFGLWLAATHSKFANSWWWWFGIVCNQWL